jgi:hypothetical protein
MEQLDYGTLTILALLLVQLVMFHLVAIA